MDCIVVMGVAGSGKSTVAAALAAATDRPLAEGDDFHPPANLAAMRAGVPLTDADRWPWLDALGTWIDDHPGDTVVACSALRRAYRARLSEGRPHVRFCHVSVPPQQLTARLAVRRGHFLPPTLLASQLAILEPLARDEPGVTVDGDAPPGEVLRRVREALGV